MYEQRRYFPEETSMEKNRDARDYALVNGFGSAREFITFLRGQLNAGDRVLDMGCGNGIASWQISRGLRPQGIELLALDSNLPRKKHRLLKYIIATFSDTGLEDKSVKNIFSVCGLFMYAESLSDLYDHAAEASRILADEGRLSVVVDPVILGTSYETKMANLLGRIRSSRGTTYSIEDRFLQDELEKVKTAKRLEIELMRRTASQIWVQSPTIAGNHFKANIDQLLDSAGLTIQQRLFPSGGMMLGDAITLIATTK